MEISGTSRSLLAGGAVVVTVGGAISGTMSPLVTLICAVSLPVTIVFSPGWSNRTATAVGLAHLLLVADVLRGLDGHDLRYALSDALLGVCGLHAARLATRRDHAVAIGIQVAILACGLSQVPTTTDGTIGTLVWVIAWMSQITPQLWTLRAGPGALARPAGQREWPALVGVFVVAALVWLIVPIPSLRAPRSLLSDNSSFTPGELSSAGQTPQATPGTDRVGDTTMNLDARGHGTNTPVLYARGSDGLLRGEIFDHYDGTSFTRTATPSQPLIDDQQVPLPASAGGVDQQRTVDITLIQPQASVLSVGQPLEVGLSQPATADQLGDVDVSQPLPSGSSYTTIGGVPGSTTTAAVTPADSALWLQLPAELPRRVRDLAATWAAGAIGPLAVSAALEAHMGSTLRYDLDSPVPARGHDAVDDVLFNSHRGFCEQFAATEVVLLRSLGIPARVIGGFAPGRPIDGGAHLVTDSDAHAWVEVWVPHGGWVTTDPTANVPLADSTPESLRQKIADIPWYVWLLIAGGLALVVGLVIVTRRLLRRHTDQIRRAAEIAAGPAPGPVRAAFAELAAAGAVAGTPLRSTETPGDYLMRVPGGWSRHEEILPALERELWGPTPPADATTERAVTALGELAAGLAAVPV